MRLNLYVTQKTLYEKNIIRDLIIRKNDTNIIDTFYYNEEDILVDISGATIFFTVKNKPSDIDNDAILKKTITSLTDPQNGNCEIELSSTDTNLTVGNYVYDIQIKLSTGKIYTCSEGNICIKQDITIRTS